MARKQKATVDYFPHSTIHKDTIFILKSKWGNDGYAVWFQLLEKLGISDGHYLDLNKPAARISLAAYCGVQEHLLLEILDTLAELDAIDHDLWRQKCVFCQHFVDGITDAYRRRINSLPTREKVQKFISGDINIISDDINGINAVRSTERERERERERKEEPSSSSSTGSLVVQGTDASLPAEQTAKMMTLTEVRFVHAEAFGTAMPGGCNGPMGEACREFTAAAIRQAFETAAVQGKPNVAYVLGILRGNGRSRDRPGAIRAEMVREKNRQACREFAGVDDG